VIWAVTLVEWVALNIDSSRIFNCSFFGKLNEDWKSQDCLEGNAEIVVTTNGEMKAAMQN